MTGTLPRVRGNILFLPALPQFLPVAKMLGISLVKREFSDTRMPAWVPVPYSPEHTKLVNRIAQTALPGPAMVSWKYPGMHSPYFHQRETVDFFTQNRRAICLNDMGTGKTASTLWAQEYLRGLGLIKRTLIFSPLSTLRVVWANEIFRINPTKAMAVAHGSKKKREDALFGDAEYVVTNHDALRLMDIEKVAEHFDSIVVDELGVFRTWQSGSMPQRYKQLLRLAHHENIKWFWGLTGTPTPNGPHDAWAIVKLLDPTFKTSKTQFKMSVMHQVSEFRWIPKPGSMDRVNTLLQPSIRFAKEDVLKFLPAQVFTDREVEMSPEQKKAHDKIRKDFTAEVNGEEITAANAAVLLSKLLQIALGSVRTSGDPFDDTGAAPVQLPIGNRVKEVVDLIEQTQGKTLIFCQFKAPLRRLVKELKAKGIKAVAVDGDVSAGKRTTYYQNFQDADDPQVIVAHPATTAHGITLTAADLIIWYGPTFSAEHYEQANARAHRPGQKRTVTVVHLSSTPQERAIYKVLKERGAMQDTLLDLAKDTI